MTPSEKQAKQQEPPSDPQELREEIKDDRQDLGETVEALAQKADVKTQVREKVDERKQQLSGAQEQLKTKVGETTGQAKQRPVPIGAAVAALLAGLILLRLIRRR